MTPTCIDARGDPEIREKKTFFYNFNANYITFVHNQEKIMPI